jgi:hypothetical protein
MRSVFIFSALLFFAGCSDNENKPAVDSLSKKDSIKKALQEDLPPPSDIKQFNWFYSAFAQAAITGNDTLFDVNIHPEYGLWIIYSNGAMPQLMHVKHILEYKNAAGKSLLPFDRNVMINVPKEEALPVVDCNNKNYWSKSGCFTSMENKFAEQKIWKYASLPADKDKEIEELASTITRTVINTANYSFYFSLIKGTWYLTFMDVRRPCEA